MYVTLSKKTLRMQTRLSFLTPFLKLPQSFNFFKKFHKKLWSKLHFPPTVLTNKSPVWLRIKENTKCMIASLLIVLAFSIVVCCVCFWHYDTFLWFFFLYDEELCALHEGKCRDDSTIKNYDTFPCYRFIFICYYYSAFSIPSPF